MYPLIGTSYCFFRRLHHFFTILGVSNYCPLLYESLRILSYVYFTMFADYQYARQSKCSGRVHGGFAAFSQACAEAGKGRQERETPSSCSSCTSSSHRYLGTQLQVGFEWCPRRAWLFVFPLKCIFC